MITKEDIIKKAKADGNTEIIFKSSDPSKYSLTESGLDFITRSQIYPNTYKCKPTKKLKTYDLMLLGNAMSSPYHVNLNNNTITHFNEEFSILMSVYLNELTILLQDELGMCRIYGGEPRVQRIK